MRSRLFAYLALSVIFLAFFLSLAPFTSAVYAFPNSSAANLSAQSCNTEVSTTTSQNFVAACTSPFTRIDYNDATVQAMATLANHQYAGMRISSYNSAITPCSSIQSVQICYEWWVSASSIDTCSVAVDADGGGSYTNVSTTCPGIATNPGLICTDVTSAESWTCGNFFTSSGTRALGYVQVKANTATGKVLSVDTLYFNVTYSNTPSPEITIVSPVNQSYYTSASTLLNITADRSLRWAGYVLDGGALTNLTNNSVSSGWNATETLAEGTHNLTFYANDTSSDNNQSNSTISFYVDLNNPSVGAISCSPASVNDSANLTCTASLTDAIGLNYTIIGFNATGSEVNSSQINLTRNTTATLNYTILAGNTTPGGFYVKAYVYDLSGRLNATINTTVAVLDDSVPQLHNVTYSPNTTAGLNPNEPVYINGTVTEDFAFGNIFLMYTSENSGTWTYVNMTNLTTRSTGVPVIFNATLTLTNGTWIFAVNASDVQGNQNVSTNYTLIITNEGAATTTSTASSSRSSSTVENPRTTTDTGVVSQTVEATRGTDGTSFTISVSPPIEGSTIENLVITIDGQPTATSNVQYGENGEIQIAISTPPSAPIEEYVTVTLQGTLVKDGVSTPYVEKRRIRLAIQVVNDQRTIDLLAKAKQAIKQMDQNNFNTTKVKATYAQAEQKLKQNRTQEVYYLAERIVLTNQTAFLAEKTIRQVLEANLDPQKSSALTGQFTALPKPTLRDLLNSTSIFSEPIVIDLIHLAIIAFEQGDYDKALSLAETAKNSLLSRNKTNPLTQAYLNWPLILAGIAIIAIFLLSRRKTHN